MIYCLLWRDTLKASNTLFYRFLPGMMSESEKLKARLLEMEQLLKTQRIALENQMRIQKSGKPIVKPKPTYINDNGVQREMIPYQRKTTPLGNTKLSGEYSKMVTRTTDSPEPVDLKQGEFVRQNLKGSLSLMSSQAFKDNQLRQMEVRAKRGEEKNRRKKERLIRLLKAHIDMNRIHFGSFNRIEIDGAYYALVHKGMSLAVLTVPQAFPDSFKPTIELNNKVYQVCGKGDYELSNPKPEDKIDELCKFYRRSGICKFKDQCEYIHNPEWISLCSSVLNKSMCQTPNCSLSHKPSQFNAPSCKYFSTNNCTNPNCVYSHRIEDSSSAICREFAVGGVCPKGRKCTLRHCLICPDMIEYGVCYRKSKCQLNHTLSKPETIAVQKVEIRNEDNYSTDSKRFGFSDEKSKLNFEELQKEFMGLEEDDDSTVDDPQAESDDDELPRYFTQDSSNGNDPLNDNQDYVEI